MLLHCSLNSYCLSGLNKWERFSSYFFNDGKEGREGGRGRKGVGSEEGGERMEEKGGRKSWNERGETGGRREEGNE